MFGSACANHQFDLRGLQLIWIETPDQDSIGQAYLRVQDQTLAWHYFFVPGQGWGGLQNTMVECEIPLWVKDADIFQWIEPKGMSVAPRHLRAWSVLLHNPDRAAKKLCELLENPPFEILGIDRCQNFIGAIFEAGEADSSMFDELQEQIGMTAYYDQAARMVANSDLKIDGKPCRHTDNSFGCVEYLRNYDGDTITVNIHNVHPLIGKKISLRVNGIDTPEMKTKDPCEKRLAKVAKRRVQEELQNAARIDIENIDRGKYFRIVGDVYVDGRNLAEILVQEKLAVPYDGGTKHEVNWCELGK